VKFEHDMNRPKVDAEFTDLGWLAHLLETKSADLSHIDVNLVVRNVATSICKGMNFQAFMHLAAETCGYLQSDSVDYGLLGGRILTHLLKTTTDSNFLQLVTAMSTYKNPISGLVAPLLDLNVCNFIQDHGSEITAALQNSADRDDNFDFFAVSTLMKSYFLRMHGEVVERTQYLFMRVACGLHVGNIKLALQTYYHLSMKHFIHASPTLFNAGTPSRQLSSCFLLTMQNDSIAGIYDTLKQCALISKEAGGVGLSVQHIRAKGSYIRGTNGESNGLVPMLRVFNNTARYVDQGGGKRKGAFAVYLEPWHADIFDFLDLRKNHGVETSRARDLFLGLWIPDLFMQRVENDADWTLFCPNEAPGLCDHYGEDFNRLYEKYENPEPGHISRARKTIKARALWQAILDAQIETGNPYMMFKDACNSKSNQKHLGCIRGSNLCTEIVQYTSPSEVAVCNLASISLVSCVQPADPARTGGPEFDFTFLASLVRVLVQNMNNVIDINHYPVPEARTSNMKHRPIGLGVQGLADTFVCMRLPFESAAAADLNRKIFETIYFAACSASCALAEAHGAAYPSYKGSPMSLNQFQFDLWDVKPTTDWNWEELRQRVATHGMRNSLLVAPMPTASTAQILGNNECFEPYVSNMYVRRTLAGEFVCVNQWLVRDLRQLGRWDSVMKNRIIANNGSVQGVEGVPPELQELYKTAWEIKSKTLIDMATDRAAFIDQSQSLNVFMPEPTHGKLTSMHFYTWKKGLKTGMYYLRTKPAADPIKFTVITERQDPEITKSDLCSLETGDCTSCGS